MGPVGHLALEPVEDGRRELLPVDDHRADAVGVQAGPQDVRPDLGGRVGSEDPREQPRGLVGQDEVPARSTT